MLVNNVVILNLQLLVSPQFSLYIVKASPAGLVICILELGAWNPRHDHLVPTITSLRYALLKILCRRLADRLPLCALLPKRRATIVFYTRQSLSRTYICCLRILYHHEQSNQMCFLQGLHFSAGLCTHVPSLSCSR